MINDPRIQVFQQETIEGCRENGAEAILIPGIVALKHERVDDVEMFNNELPKCRKSSQEGRTSARVPQNKSPSLAAVSHQMLSPKQKAQSEFNV